MSAIKELIPEVIKTGDYATCVMQIPNGVAGEIPFLLMMTNSHVELRGRDKNEGFYGTQVQITVLHDNGLSVSLVAHWTVKLNDCHDALATAIHARLVQIGATGEVWREQIEHALSEMIPV